jgi:hypothetical protein
MDAVIEVGHDEVEPVHVTGIGQEVEQRERVGAA